ncbi:hypothetical protein [Desulfuromonas sp. TF]|uniref:RipA family octameric membrane protein n=1 Tax=Desulfuromonas sp. TF TaxID=1232410 RepID=UPI0018726142|nr:hypothetical protein [Desulfuromonas sp. TF]
MIKKFKKFMKYFINLEQSALEPLKEEDYRRIFLEIDETVAKEAFEKAWAIRNFEIEMYWKRATYFWAFIASTFVGYFALISSEHYSKSDKFGHVEVYFLICIGFCLSVAWILTNKGSKAWQRNWEAHVDLLEDKFTGPLYKIVNPEITYSVSKINEIVSFVFAIIWFLLGLKFMVQQDLINFTNWHVNWFVLFSTLGVLLAIVSMVFGYGRGRFTERSVIMHKRKVIYENKESNEGLTSASTGQGDGSGPRKLPT